MNLIKYWLLANPNKYHRSCFFMTNPGTNEITVDIKEADLEKGVVREISCKSVEENLTLEEMFSKTREFMIEQEKWKKPIRVWGIEIAAIVKRLGIKQRDYWKKENEGEEEEK